MNESYRAFPLMSLINLQEKLGVLTNELSYLRSVLKYYLSVTDENILVSPSQAGVDQKRIDHSRLLAVVNRLQDDLVTSLHDLQNFYALSSAKPSSHDWFVFYSMHSYVNEKAQKCIDRIASINYKLLQLRQSTNPKYSPTPNYLKRHQNLLLHDFLSSYISRSLLPAFRSLLPKDIKHTETILHWEHTNSDSVVWDLLENDKSEKELTIFLKESYWALEMPVHNCFLLHEISHSIYAQIVSSSNYMTNDLMELRSEIINLRRIMNDHMMFFNMISPKPEVEFICDFFATLFYGEAYLASLFLAIFGNDMFNMLITQPEKGIKSAEFVGNLPVFSYCSWWIRLKVIVETLPKYKGKKNSYWVNGVDSWLGWYHDTLNEMVTPNLQRAIKPIVSFEESLAKLIAKRLKKFSKLHSIKKYIRNSRKLIRQYEGKNVCSNRLNRHYKVHLRKYWKGLSIDTNKINKIKTISDMPIKQYQQFMPKLYDNIKSSKDKLDVLHKIEKNTIPTGRLTRYASRYYLSKEGKNIDCFSLNLNKGSDSATNWQTPVIELGLCKYRIDLFGNDNLNVSWKDIRESLDSYCQRRAEIDLTEERRQRRHYSYISFGTYDFIMIRPGYSSKSIQSNDDNDLDMWPPKMEIPYFMNIHSLVQIQYNNSKESSGLFSGLFQLRFDSESRHSKFINSVRDFVEDMQNMYSKFSWELYSSTGWEDLLLIVNNIELESIFSIKSWLFNKPLFSRTMTQILWDGKENLFSYFGKEIISNDMINVITSIRVRSNVEIENIKDRLTSALMRICGDCFIDRINLIPGSYDIEIVWKNGISAGEFIKCYQELLNDSETLELITDISTHFKYKSTHRNHIPS